MKTNSRRVSVQSGNPTPSAHLTVNKNRVKIYNIEGDVFLGASSSQNKTCGNYYLQDGQTFEIELFNPTMNKIKADITLDGNLISAGGLVIKPGERVYLERFVDSDNKFVFSTYEVEDSEEVANAISNNGRLEVKFYREMHQLYYPTTLQSPWTIWGGCGIVPEWTPAMINTVYYSSNAEITPINNTFTTTTFNSEENTTLNVSNETGRTEKGEASGQTFDVSYDKFADYAFETVEYKILPLSKQPITKKDLNVKRYCHECGSVTKIKFKFCPSCGEKL